MGYNKETEMWEGYIYLITNKINNKKYIGQTRRKPIYRFNEHCSIYNKSNSAIDISMRKYGKNNFLFEILEYVEEKTKEDLIKKLDKKEIEYISIFDTYKGYGYNNTEGGSSFNHHGISVDQYTIDGAFIKSYETISDAVNSISSGSSSYITLVCNGKRRTCGGYVWRYHNDSFDKYSIENINKKSIDVYTKDGIYIDNLQSIVEAAEKYNVSISTISSCAKGKIHLVKNKYVFRNHGDRFDKYIVDYSDKKPVDVYDYKKEIIESYDSITSASIAYNTTPITISEACYGKTMTIDGKVFRFKGDSFDKYNVKFRACWQFDSNKNFIKEYKNQSVASRETGISLTTIQKYISKNIIKQINGYYFTKVGIYP